MANHKFFTTEEQQQNSPYLEHGVPLEDGSLVPLEEYYRLHNEKVRQMHEDGTHPLSDKALRKDNESNG